MIYGIVPVGGHGLRLGLPFAKEMLPLKGYNQYYPVCKYTVDNMLEAGCDKIYFIHGTTEKQVIKDYFNGDRFVHIQNLGLRQSEVFSAFYNNIDPTDKDIYLYGLPDTYYVKNLFVDMLSENGLVCGMYRVDSNAKVGRIDRQTGKFVKSILIDELGEHCWGVLKMDCASLSGINDLLNNHHTYEAEEILNCLSFKLIYGGDYFDLGTWESINKYWNL